MGAHGPRRHGHGGGGRSQCSTGPAGRSRQLGEDRRCSTHVGDHAPACQVVRVAGIEAEAELAFGGLNRLCERPSGNISSRLPVPQRSALETAFGLSAGTPADRFLVGLAVLSLLAEAAARQPVVCLIDDAQWLDRISAQTLSFVGRRLLAERVVLLAAVREPVVGDALADLPALRIEGLGDHDARTLLARGCPGRVDDRGARSYSGRIPGESTCAPGTST